MRIKPLSLSFLLIALLGIAAADNVHAQTTEPPTGCVTLTWTPATENTDGTAYTDPAGVNIYWSSQSGGPYQLEVDPTPETPVVDNPAITTYQVCDLQEGTWYFVATSVNASGIESDYSAEASKTIIIPSTPLPPSNVIIEEEVVYQIVKRDNGMDWNAVGWVPADTLCDETYSVTIAGVTRFAVPWQAVRYASQVQPKLVVASCGAG